MRPLRNFKTNQCCHLISRIANRAFFLNDEEKTRFVELLARIRALYSGTALAEIEKEWKLLKKVGVASGRERFRRRYLRRMWSASEFMKTLKQTATMSYNGPASSTGF